MYLQRIINPFSVYAEGDKRVFRLLGISETEKKLL